MRMEQKFKRLFDIYNHPRHLGVFYYMQKLSPKLKTLIENISGKDSITAAQSLDLDYIYNRSGEKKVSCLLLSLLSNIIVNDDDVYVTFRNGKKVVWDSDEYYDELNQQIIINIIEIRFLDKWSKLYKAIETDYNITEPYNMKITDEVGFSRTRSSESTDTSEDEGNDSSYGFNSIDAVPTDKNKSTSTDTSKGSSNDNSSTNREVTRSGNIGNRSSMELIEEELKLRQYQVIEEIYNDLDNVLTRHHY